MNGEANRNSGQEKKMSKKKMEVYVAIFDELVPAVSV